MKKELEEIKDLISEDKIERAIEKLRVFLRGKDEEYQIILQSARYHKFYNDLMAGTLAKEEQDIVKKTLVSNVLELLRAIEVNNSVSEDFDLNDEKLVSKQIKYNQLSIPYQLNSIIQHIDKLVASIPRWKLVYQVDKNGQPIDGGSDDFNKLKELIREGRSVKVLAYQYSEKNRNYTEEPMVIEPDFISIDSIDGQVYVQKNHSIAYWRDENATLRFPGSKNDASRNYWIHFIFSTVGKHEQKRVFFSGEDNHLTNNKYKTQWFVRY